MPNMWKPFSIRGILAMTCGGRGRVFGGSPPLVRTGVRIFRVSLYVRFCYPRCLPPFDYHGSACGSFDRSRRSLRCCLRLLHTKCAGRSCPWLCPPVATGSTWSAVKLMGSGCRRLLSIGSLHSQQTGFGCAIRRSRRRLYSGSLVRWIRARIRSPTFRFVVQLRFVCFERRYPALA